MNLPVKFLSLKKETMRIITSIGVCLVVLVILHFFVGRPVLQKTRKLMRESKEVYKQLSEIDRMIRENPNPKQKMAEIRLKREEFKAKADAKNELPRIIQQLTKKSSEMDIEIVSIKPIERPQGDEAVLPEGVSKAYLEMVVKAPYRVIGDYLEEIKRLPVLCTTEGVTLRRFVDLKNKKDAETEGKVIATLIISTYTVWKI